jgi:hypothetical protein
MALPSGTNFPGAIDGVGNGYGAVSTGNTITATYANDQTSAILAIENTIGANPFTDTPYSTIGGALAGLVAAMPNFGSDIGSANAYQVDLSPAPAAYAAGQMVVFAAANANSGASTLTLNSLSAQNLVADGGSALVGGEIAAGQIVTAVYDGSQFQVISTPVTTASIQDSALIFAADTGSANAYAIALNPTPPAYTAGQMVVFQAANANTGPSTLSVNGATAQNLVDNGGAAFSGGEIAAGQIVAAVYDGTQFQLVAGATSGGGGGGTVLPATCDLRLTLVSGNPIGTETDSGSTIYLSPYVGTDIALYNGTAWDLLATPEVSLDISGLSDGIYDIFAYNDSGTVTLEVSDPWTDMNDRDDPLVQQDGVWVKSADSTRRLVGTSYVTSGTTYNSYQSGLYLWNAQHRLPRRVTQSMSNWSSNAGWSNILGVSYLVGLVIEAFIAVASGIGQGNPTYSAQCEIAMGQSTVTSPDTYNSPMASAQETTFLSATYVALPGDIGVQTINMFAQTSVSGVTVSLLQEDPDFNAVWLIANIWV